MNRIVECVPNFSEGRNPDTVAAIVAAARAVSGVLVLDQEMDSDHHRAVITLAGEPEAVGEAAVRCARVASERIDLRVHQGAHPRIGATDVVPFIPIRGVTMDECVVLARQVGSRIGRDLNIPVFLYERAATRQERTNLEAIRRGNLEGLASRLADDAAWVPDFGPPRLHPTAGATIVGARPALIAFNVNLATDNLEIAKAIAKVVRFSSGGLPCVKGLGVPLTTRGMVQVSMNLTNFEATPIHVAFEAVRKEAEQRGTRVAGSEIIGLVPQAALLQASEYFLKVERFDPTQVLETRLEMKLAEAPLHASRLTLHGFVESVAAGTPTPGGGSVAALAGSLAAALGLMACRVSRSTPGKAGPPGASPCGPSFEPEETRLDAIGQEFRSLIQADAEAFEKVLQAYRMPKTDPVRAEAITASLERATEVPLRTATLASETVRLLKGLEGRTKPSVSSDLRVGILMATACGAGGLANVEINMKTLNNHEFVVRVSRQVKEIKRILEEQKAL
ncbi:MAG: glutamate formimidoyltransferase [Nitrospirae bacterium]|nr:glutamate formimidoyltransferase [Nitrospirota bacterium]